MQTAPSPSFVFQHRSRAVRRTELRTFWKELCANLGEGLAATCLITDDEHLRQLNRDFRKKDTATDVLSFPAQGGGDIAISFDQAQAQATELGHSIEDELRILMLHGLLHLRGLDHEVDQGEMARAETRWRKKLRLPTGLIERSRA
jgi:probable rRNA maturation factor